MKKIKKVTFKRRREYKTDYRLRIGLLKAGKPRLVIRKTDRYIIAQIVNSKESQDFTVTYTNSKELEKYDWKSGFKNLPAAYLTGFLAAKKAEKQKVKEAIVDIGLQRSTKGSRIYAVIKGAIDGGLRVSCPEEMFDEERIKGGHLKVKDIKQKIDEIKEKISRTE